MISPSSEVIATTARFRWRFLLAAVFAPVLAFAPTLIALSSIGLFTGREVFVRWREVEWGELLRGWQWFSLGLVSAGAVLWRLRWVKLRHHMLFGLMLGLVAVSIVLFEFFGILAQLNDPASRVVIPYPCTELVRYETLDLPGAVDFLMLATSSGAVFKWLAHGLSHQSTTWGWRIAGALYLAALTFILMEPYHYFVDSRIPSWTGVVEYLCVRATH